MNTERIVNSIVDTDLYKLTMGQAVFHHYSGLNAGYEFINRGQTEFPDHFDTKLQRQIELMSQLKLTPQERRFLEEKCNGVFTEDYLDWFANFRFNPDEVNIRRENGGLAVNVNGPWERTIYWEVPLMAVISELYFQETEQSAQTAWEEKCIQKALRLKEAGALFADFGTRRRFSYLVHDQVVEILKEHAGNSLLGTSNIHLALKHGLKPVGTFAHEWVMAHAGIFGPEHANKIALEVWSKEFNGKLSIALTDTLTTDVFLKDLDSNLLDIFKSFRQDSGSPEKWTDQIITHLISLGVDLLTRTALYSDALTVERVLDLLKYNQGKINSLFGIGTHFTNDVGVKPLNIVIKLLYIENFNRVRQGVCKLSDDLGKISGDPQAIRDTLRILNIKIPAKRAA